MAKLVSPEGCEPDVQRGLARFKTRMEGENVRRKRWTWVAAAAAVTCLYVPAFPVTRVFAQRCVSACIAETGTVREMLRIRLSRSPAVVKKQAADFTLTDASGKLVHLSDFRGHVVLLNFWATWCGPCKVEIPWFGEFQEKYREAGLVVLGVSMDDDGWKSVRPYMEQKGVNYRVMVGDDKTAQVFGGVESLPTTFLIDKTGGIAVSHTGLVGKETYQEEIEKLLF